MKTLIYTLAYGERCREFVKIMVDSLRRFGKYDGDIRVYTDREIIGFSGNECHVDNYPLALKTPHMAKAMCGCTLSQFCAPGYDRVMFMDADVVCVGDINPMFEHDEISAPVECVITEQWNSFFSLPSHPGDVGTYGFNSGTIVGGFCEFSEMCRAWWDSMIAHKAWELQGYDQPVFNHLNRTGQINIRPFNREWVHFLTDDSYPVSKDTILVHVKDPMKLQIMRAIAGVRGMRE